MNEDLAHDAHLRAALRHAPDHALSPPSRVTQNILAAAQQAHRAEVIIPTSPPPRMHPAGAPTLRHWLRRMASPRWAGAWAVALLAALGLGLWVDLGLQSTPEQAAGGATAPGVSVAESTQHGNVADTPMRPRTDDVTAQTRSEAAAPVARSAEVAAARAPAAGVAQTPRPATPPTVSDAMANSGAAGSLQARGSRGVAEAKVAGADAASPPLALLRRAQSEVAAGSARWTWAAPGRPIIKPLDGAALTWLARVAQSAQGPWRDVGERDEGVQAVEARWWRDGWPVATLRIEAQGLRWIQPGGSVRYAPLDAATLQQLHGF